MALRCHFLYNKRMNNILDISNKEDFYNWLNTNFDKEDECYLKVKRGKPVIGIFSYLDAVEAALCFGWIDSKQIKIDNVIYQRFSPRKKGSPISELNKERVRRLIKLGLMTEAGLKAIPNLNKEYKPDKVVINALIKANVYETFLSFHPLYQRIRIYNVSFYKKINKKTYKAALKHLIDQTRKNKMFGEWNDYGRLLDY